MSSSSIGATVPPPASGTRGGRHGRGGGGGRREGRHETVPVDLFPVTQVRNENEELKESQLDGLISQYERQHKDGARENFIWGPVDCRLKVYHEDHGRYPQELLPLLFDSQPLRDEVTTSIIDNIVAFCELDQDHFDDDDDVDPDLVADQERLFSESRRRQKRFVWSYVKRFL
jgi:hypothetical protein